MKRTLTLSLCVAALFWVPVLRSQELTGNAAAEKIEGAVRIRMNTAGTAPVFVTFDPETAVPTDRITELRQRLFGNRPEDTWSLIRSEEDELGMVHDRYQQQYRQLDVDGHVFIFHGKGGKFLSANGHFAPMIDLPIQPSLTSDEAIAKAAAGMRTPVPLEKTAEVGAELVVLMLEQQPVLAYKCAVFARQPLVNRLVYVDAHNGNVLREVSRLCSTDVPGTAQTHFSGTQPIVADFNGLNYRLRESGRGSGIETYNNSTFELYQDNDNLWNNANPAMDEFATDVHFGTEATYDFFYEHFGRDSYDDNGGLIRSYVNDEWVGVNAYWSGGSDNSMHYGNGDFNYFPVASLEIAGHELSHGVTEYSAGLEYWGESGALNESFSDIFGSTIRFLEAPSVASWKLGDQLLRPGGIGDAAFRNMSDPNEFACPDTYNGQFFNNGDIVHFNSGIQNFWYYLLVEGGSGTNDLGNAYDVTAIGMNDAVRIAYRNLVYYLTPTSTFLDARDGAEQAATDLFGVCSQQHQQTIHAWYAVGVGPVHAVLQPVAAYETTNDFACTAPLTTQFAAEGNYASYHWDFGDGTTSAQQNPAHTYLQDGHYTVTLIVSNNVSCQSPDTLEIADAVVIDEIDPVAAFTFEGPALFESPVAFTDASLYGPTAWEWDFGDGGTSALQHPEHTFAQTGMYTVTLTVHNCHGQYTYSQLIEVIDYVVFCQTSSIDREQGVIYDSGGATGNYAPGEFCGMVIRPCNATSITLTFEELDLEDGFDYLYVFDGTNSNGTWLGYYTGNILPIPVTGNSGAMYIEFASDFSFELSGFKLSYTADIAASPAPGSAQFYVYPDSGAVGQPVQFQDASEQYPLSWSWNFGDGETSTLQHPVHQYDLPGTYVVTLTVTYCDGSAQTALWNYYVGGMGIGELSAGDLLSVSPNPSSDAFVIHTSAVINRVDLRLLDLSGRVVYERKLPEIAADGLVIDPATLSNGQYMLEVGYLFNGMQGLERHKLQLMR